MTFAGRIQTRACACGGRHELGTSLIELMISLLISALILAGLTQVFSVNRSTYRTDEGIARLQENSRFAIEFLTRDIRNAGSMGCLTAETLRGDTSPPGPLSLIEDISGSLIDLASLRTPILGFDSTLITSATTAYTVVAPHPYPPALTFTTDPVMGATLIPATGVATDSDAIVIRSMDQDVAGFSAPMIANQYYVPSSSGITANQVILVTDCDRAVINRVSSVATSGPVTTLTVTPTTRPPTDYVNQYSGQIAALRTVVYYIGVGSNNGPALFSRNFSDGIGAPQELVEGVENLQFLYGIDNGCVTGDTEFGTMACKYAPASEVPDWGKVRSVRVGMLVATSNIETGRDNDATNLSGATESSLDTNTYSIQGIALTPIPDRRRRRAFETTIKLRNE